MSEANRGVTNTGRAANERAKRESGWVFGTISATGLSVQPKGERAGAQLRLSIPFGDLFERPSVAPNPCASFCRDSGRLIAMMRAGWRAIALRLRMITPRTRLLVLCVIATIPILLAAQDPAPRETVLNHVSLIDMTGRAVQPDMSVVIRGDRIAAIERAAGFNRPGARVIDLTGKFLMPGLVDMHNHLDRGESMPGPPIPGQAAERDVRGESEADARMGLHHRFLNLPRQCGSTRVCRTATRGRHGYRFSQVLRCRPRRSPSPQATRHNHVSPATCLVREMKHARMSARCRRPAWTRSS